MNEFEEIQRLIRLKRHERPPEGFVEDFVRSFQQRQRAEMLQRSARGLLWERVTTYFSDVLSPKWAWAAATALVVAGAGFMLRPNSANSTQVAKNDPGSFEVGVSITTDPNAFMADVESYLRARHRDSGVLDETLGAPGGSLLVPDPASRAVHGGALPASFRYNIAPGPIPASQR